MASYEHQLLRLYKRAIQQGDCVVFTGKTNKDGYGQIGVSQGNGRTELAHRCAWQLTRGPIPAGLLVLHMCDNPPCINPDHLWLGTQFDNMRDCINKDRRALQRPQYGERNHRAKLTDEAVREIRALPETSSAYFAQRFGVSLSAIKLARSGKTWKHV